nr:hypothetical protein [Tanacetum cinerariifolium]
MDVDVPPDIIDIDEDDDLIDDEDVIPHNLVDSDDEDLTNDNDDDMSVDVARGHSGDGGSDYRPPPGQDNHRLLREPKNPTEEAGKSADAIPMGKPGTLGGDVEAQGSRPQHTDGCAYTDDEIIAIARRGKQQGYIPVLVGFWRDTAGTSSLYPSLDARTPPISMRLKNKQAAKEIDRYANEGQRAEERIPLEPSSADLPQRHVIGDSLPRRHVARVTYLMSPGKEANIVVDVDALMKKHGNDDLTNGVFKALHDNAADVLGDLLSCHNEDNLIIRLNEVPYVPPGILNDEGNIVSGKEGSQTLVHDHLGFPTTITNVTPTNAGTFNVTTNTGINFSGLNNTSSQIPTEVNIATIFGVSESTHYNPLD